MIGLLQRVTRGTVRVGDTTVAAIGAGLVVLVGVERDDGEPQAARLVERLLNYRVFADAEGRMNRSLRDTAGGLLLVPQFTLVADTEAGNRPSFSGGADPATAERLFHSMLAEAKAQHSEVAAGVFGANMDVELVNQGPVTFSLRVSAGT
jgi:D-tyrosyl-tRNA(Tyr) deacylase